MCVWRIRVCACVYIIALRCLYLAVSMMYCRQSGSVICFNCISGMVIVSAALGLTRRGITLDLTQGPLLALTTSTNKTSPGHNVFIPYNVFIPAEVLRNYVLVALTVGGCSLESVNVLSSLLQ